VPEGSAFDQHTADFLEHFGSLLSAAIVISLVGFMEAISIAKAIAAKTKQKIDPNQELIGQGSPISWAASARRFPFPAPSRARR